MTGKNVNKENEEFFFRLLESGILSARPDGTIFNNKTKREIGAFGSGGYKKISVKDMANNRIRHMQVHRLIYRKFKGCIPEGHEIDHDDNNKSNNRPENLIALTPKQNTTKAFKDGRIKGFNIGNTMHLKRKRVFNRFSKFKSD